MLHDVLHDSFNISDLNYRYIKSLNHIYCCCHLRLLADNSNLTLLNFRRKEIRDVDFLRCLGYDGTPRFFCNGKPVYHFAGCSSFSEYTVIPANSCIKVRILKIFPLVIQ